MDAPPRFPFIAAIAPRFWLPVFAAVLMATSVAMARDDADNPNIPDPDDLTPAEKAEPGAPEKAWTEDRVSLPPFPRARDLLPLRIDSADPDYRYFIDVNSVTLTSDEVVRYTVIIQAPSGSSNIIYEGIRCATDEVKTFAYGTRDGRFRLMQDPRWIYVHTPGAFAYRTTMVETYVCDANGWALNSDSVLERLVMHDPRRPRIDPKKAASGN